MLDTTTMSRRSVTDRSSVSEPRFVILSGLPASGENDSWARTCRCAGSTSHRQGRHPRVALRFSGHRGCFVAPEAESGKRCDPSPQGRVLGRRRTGLILARPRHARGFRNAHSLDLELVTTSGQRALRMRPGDRIETLCSKGTPPWTSRQPESRARGLSSEWRAIELGGDAGGRAGPGRYVARS